MSGCPRQKCGLLQTPACLPWKWLPGYSEGGLATTPPPNQPAGSNSATSQRRPRLPLVELPEAPISIGRESTRRAYFCLIPVFFS